MICGATPQFRGEQLGRHLILVKGAMLRYGSIGGAVNDVACQFAAFIRNRGPAIGVPNSLKCILNALHAKAHPWWCEFSLCIRNTPGGGWLTGEEDERLFQMLGALRLRLMNASLATYKEAVTEMSLYLNGEKRRVLPQRLVQQAHDAVRETPVAWQLFSITVEEARVAGYISVEQSRKLVGVDADGTWLGYEVLEACRVDVQTEALRQKQESRKRYAYFLC